jgi:heterodisulfide reductase subunit A-like polyferredoxin
MANIREQDSWVHRIDPQPATAKAKQLVAMAVAKARKLRSLSSNFFEVTPRALVIGGGLAGMTAALSISRQGYDVSLVERKSELGGNLNHIYIANPGSVDPQNLLKEILSAVLDNPRINVLTGAEILDHSGYTGHFSTRIMLSSGTVISLEHGTTIVTTGGRETIPVEYLYNQHPRVLTQRELETLLHQDPSSVLDRQSFIMIQCVGSRNDDHPYCSRVCCTQALKNSLAIKQLNPNTRVVILYRDIRSYGFREFLYRQARQAGVIFLEYDPEKKPLVKPADKDRLELKIAIQPEDDEITLTADWLVLSTGIEAEASNSVLAQILKVPLDESGFFLEAHVKLRPVDFAAEGIYLAGLAHSPRSLEETIAQANAAAIRAVRVLSKPNLQSTPIIASVNPKLCAACGLCVEVCPYGARILEPGMLHAEVIEVLCQGCGACVTACPNKASRQKGFDFTQVIGMLEAAVNVPKQM